jgi:hypothetical protein
MANILACKQCEKTFRGQSGLDWHRSRSGHLEREQEKTAAHLEPESPDRLSEIASTVAVLEDQVGRMMNLHAFHRVLGTATCAPQQLITKLYSLADELSRTRH